jgi:WD40 repeat protein/tRNA A-37 threonylcarbamoyl transferase component Bud32
MDEPLSDDRMPTTDELSAVPAPEPSSQGTEALSGPHRPQEPLPANSALDPNPESDIATGEFESASAPPAEESSSHGTHALTSNSHPSQEFALANSALEATPGSDGATQAFESSSLSSPEVAAADAQALRDAQRLSAQPSLSMPGATKPAAGKAAAPAPKVEGYVLLGELGRGGMGVVYKARQVALKRIVALKMILAGSHAGTAQINRFMAEAKAVARLRHPNIVPIYEIGEQDGLHYFSMEFVEDGVLEKYIHATPQPAQDAAHLIEMLARAMHHAHEEGVVHRDLKPANILLRRKESAKEKEEAERSGTRAGLLPLSAFDPKITDFGLAKFLDEQDGQTRTGAVAGTPSYMAPEQASGRTKEAGPATDVYALGAILYKLLTGRPPFHADTAINTLQQVVTEEPVAPTRLQSKVPRDLETICLKCLEKETSRRYRSALELAEDLCRFQIGEPIVARPTPVWERAWKWARRRPAVAGLAALVVIVTALGLGLVTWQWRRAEDERGRALQWADQEAARRLEAQRVAVGLLRERGVGLCAQGEYGRGLLWLARALRSTPAEAGDLEDSLRVLLGGWGRYVGRVTAVFPHANELTAAALSPDGKIIVTGSMDGTARWWDTATRQPIGELLRASAGQVLAVAFSPDGRTVVTGGTDGQVCLWDRAGGKLLCQSQVPLHKVSSVAFSPDGRLVATASLDGTARLWETASGKSVGEPLRHAGAVTAVVFTRNGRVLTAGWDQVVRPWDAKSQRPSGEPWKLAHQVTALALSPDGKWVATGERDNQFGLLQIWSADTGTPAGNPVRVAAAFANVAFSPDGERIVTGGADGSARMWDRRTLKLLGEPLRHPPEKEITGVAFTPDGRMILTGGRDGTARLWDISALLPQGTPLRLSGPVTSIAFSPDGKKILTVNQNLALLWDGGADRPTALALQHTALVRCASFGPDGRVILTGDEAGLVRRWDAATGQPIGAAIQQDASLVFALFSPAGKQILTGCDDNRVRLWDADTGKVVAEPPVPGAPLQKAQFSPDGQTLVIVAGSSASLWRVSTQTAIGAPLRHQDLISTVVFSLDGKMIATASLDKTVRLWDAATAEALADSPAHEETEPITGVAFSPDGRAILTRSGATVRLWETPTWKPIGEPMRHSDPVSVSQFSPDGRVILTAGSDRMVRLWDASTSKPLGEPLPHPGGVFFAALRPDSRMLASVSSEDKGDVVRLWRVMPPMAGDADRIVRQIEVDTDLELDASDAIRGLDTATWRQRYDEFKKQAD